MPCAECEALRAEREHMRATLQDCLIEIKALRALAERYQDERDAALELLNRAQGNELEALAELRDALSGRNAEPLGQ